MICYVLSDGSRSLLIKDVKYVTVGYLAQLQTFCQYIIVCNDDVKKDMLKLKVLNRRTLVQDRRRWKELVEKAKTLH
jgi:hypothetical protein